MRMDRDCKYSNKIEERNLKIQVSPSCSWQSPNKLRFLIPSAGVVSFNDFSISKRCVSVAYQQFS